MHTASSASGSARVVRLFDQNIDATRVHHFQDHFTVGMPVCMTERTRPVPTDIRPWLRIGTSRCAGKLVSKLFAKINDMLEGGDNLVFILIDEVRLGNCMHGATGKLHACSYSCVHPH